MYNNTKDDNYSRSPNLSDLAFILSILERFLGFVGYFFLLVFGIGRFLTGLLEFTYLTRFARVFFLECDTHMLSIPIRKSYIMSSWLKGVIATVSNLLSLYMADILYFDKRLFTENILKDKRFLICLFVFNLIINKYSNFINLQIYKEQVNIINLSLS
jgi:hypothetical protein